MQNHSEGETQRRKAVDGLPSIRPLVAGIDLGSERHWVCAPTPDKTACEIADFGATTPELIRLAQWLRGRHVESVAMVLAAAREMVRLPQGNQAEVLAATRRRPINLYEQEKPHLIALPAAYYTAQVVYRTVNSEGHVPYLQDFHSVPFQRIGELLKERFAGFGPEGMRFFGELVRTQRYGKDQAARVLGLLGTCHREDLVRALERILRRKPRRARPGNRWPRKRANRWATSCGAATT
jgi:hypothetical protein